MKQLKDKEYEEYQQYLYNKAHGYIWTPETLELICNGNDGDPEQIGKQVLDDIDVVAFCRSKILDKSAVITKQGKNWYVRIEGCVITVNASSYTIITAHKEKA